MSKRASGSSRAVDRRARRRARRRGSARRARRTRAGATSATPDDPAGGAGAEALERPVVAADEHLEVGVGVQQRRDPARVARALLDGDDGVDLARRCARSSAGGMSTPRGLGVVVDHERQAGAARRPRRRSATISRSSAAVAERRQAHERARAGVGGVGGVARRGLLGRAGGDAGDDRHAALDGLGDGGDDRRGARAALRLPASPIVPVPTMPWTPASSSARDVGLQRRGVDLAGGGERGGDGGDDAGEAHGSLLGRGSCSARTRWMCWVA